MPSPSPHPPFLEFDALTAGYDRHEPVFRDLSLRLHDPGLMRIAGPNGSGKSTLLELASGFLSPFEGQARVCGVPTAAPDARRVRSVCRTAPALYPSMTARDHLAFAARCRQSELPPLLERAERYGLGEWLGSSASSLSTGNQRKLWFLACTAASTPVLILDEPFNGMDDHGVETLVSELTDWSAARLVLLIAHAMPAGLVASRSIRLGAASSSSP